MKQFLTFLFLLMAGWCMAQTDGLQRGKKVVVITSDSGPHAADVKNELAKQVKEWGYWQVVSSRSAADIVMNLSVQTHRGVTAWSWGGVTTKASVSLEDQSGQTLWQSREYKANPNGTNSFNTAKATIGKIIKEMRSRVGGGR